VNSEDSGVIDLFAIHQQASGAPQDPSTPGRFSPPASAPPPAFTTDLSGDDAGDHDDLANPFAKKLRTKLVMMAGAGAALLALGILVSSLSASGPEPIKASAAAKVEAPPPAAVVLPPPALTVAAEPPPVTASPVPAPPTTGAAAPAKPPSRAGVGRPAASKSRAVAVTAGGVKLTKVQSAGVAGK